MELVRAAVRPPVTSERVKSDVTQKLERQEVRLAHLRSDAVRAGYRLAGEVLTERRTVPRP